jgi:cytochrome c5
MKFLFIKLILILVAPWYSVAMASHSYGGLDLCKLYPEVMPPGLDSRLLPQATSEGAKLLQTYCSQCHELPGPGRHTASDWPVVLKRMIVLMDVTSRFSGLLGHVQVPTAEEGRVLREYLLQQALQPMVAQPVGFGAQAFVEQCSSCHALPDPGQHSSEEWSVVIKRMQNNMVIMKRKPPSPEVLLQVQSYLQQASTQSRMKSAVDSTNKNESHEPRTMGLVNMETWIALGPFFGLTILGLARWRRKQP